MKEFVLGVFEAREDAEKAINRLHNDVGVDTDEISYVYRSIDGKTREINAADISSSTPGEGAAKGAVTGGILGGIAGLVVAAGALPILGPVVAAGPLVSALGLGAGALGATAAGAVTGGAAGGLIGALSNMGLGEEQAQRYDDYVRAGNIMLMVHTSSPAEAASVMEECAALDVTSYGVTV